MFTRSQYMNKEVSHQEYYAQFCNQWVFALVERNIGLDVILASKDPHFNDIPLLWWDRLEDNIRAMVGSKIRQAEGQCSLSDCVCTAKAAARILKEKHQNNA
jgi:hypothetical protein